MVSYKKCLMEKCKTEKQKGEFLRKSMKDQILETLLEHDNKNYESLTVNDQFQETDLEFPRISSISEVLESERNVPTLQEELEAKKRDTCDTICVGTFYILGRAC